MVQKTRGFTGAVYISNFSGGTLKNDPFLCLWHRWKKLEEVFVTNKKSEKNFSNSDVVVCSTCFCLSRETSWYVVENWFY